MRVEPVPAEAVRPLREAVLRPDQGPEASVFAGDDHEDALHVAARDDDGRVLGVASITPEAHPRDPRPGDWRVRGMATAPEARGRGAGAALLTACLDHARDRGGARAWCNARVPAVGFYVRAGFAVESEVFEVPGIGPHVVMALPLADSRAER